MMPLFIVHGTPPNAGPPQQVLVAGIEANIPVTYGIGSQRGDKSTGCQLIGQSPVHSVSIACPRPPPVAVLGLGVQPGRLLLGLLGGGCLCFSVGTGPHPR